MTLPKLAKAADPTKLFLSLVEGFRYRHNIYEAFRDWTEIAAAEVHQLPYHTGIYAKDADYNRVEADYMAAAKKYEKEDLDRFADMLAATRLALETRHQDFLGSVYMQLELGDKGRGQVFTPYPLAVAMAEMTLFDVETMIADNGGWFTLLEPTCGAGSIVVAAADVLQKRQIDAGHSMYFTAIDIDRMCCNMAYIQLGLLGLTGIVYHGDSLRMEMQSYRWTPVARMHPRRTNQMMDSTRADWSPPAVPLPATGPVQMAMAELLPVETTRKGRKREKIHG